MSHHIQTRTWAVVLLMASAGQSASTRGEQATWRASAAGSGNQYDAQAADAGESLSEQPETALVLREEVNWRLSRGARIRAVRYPHDRPLPTLGRQQARPPGSIYRRALPAEAASRLVQATDTLGDPIYALVIDSPPVDGFVSWIAVVATDERQGIYELDAAWHTSVAGNYLTASPEQDYGIGIFDTGSSTFVMGNGNATRLGLISGEPDFLTSFTVTITGVTGSVDALVSFPLGLFIDGLGAIDPATLELDTSGMVGESNIAIAVGPGGDPDLPTAIGSPMAVYFATVVRNDMLHTIIRDGEKYTGPDIQFHSLSNSQIPDYPNVVPLELRPLGGSAVQYFPCIDIWGSCGPDGDGAPRIPSIIIGISYQSLFFFGAGVDLTDEGHSAIDKDRFIVDTGAQVTVVGSRVGARLALDPAEPDFEVEIQGVDGQTVDKPGFYIDTLDIPALGEWLSFTNVPVVLLDVSSPEGGTLDGIIGMNLFVNYNFVLRGGGLFAQEDPALELQLIAPPIDADFDDDGDVDQEDFGHLQACLSGPDVPQTDPNCQDALLDEDSDVDQDDFGLFQVRISGPAVPAGPE